MTGGTETTTVTVDGVDLAGQVLSSRGFTLGVLRRACMDASDALGEASA